MEEDQAAFDRACKEAAKDEADPQPIPARGSDSCRDTIEWATPPWIEPPLGRITRSAGNEPNPAWAEPELA
jgi:hypothetical protein